MKKSTVGGILSVVSGAMGVLLSLFLIAFSSTLATACEQGQGLDGEVIAIASAFYVSLGVIGLIISILGIMGGIFACRQKAFGLALAGAIASSLVFYPLGIVSVVLVSMGYSDFTRVIPAPPITPLAI